MCSVPHVIPGWVEHTECVIHCMGLVETTCRFTTFQVGDDLTLLYLQTFGSEGHKLKRKLSPSADDTIRTSKFKLLLIAAILVILALLIPTRFSQNLANQITYISKLVAYPHCVLTGKGPCSMTTSGGGSIVAVVTLYNAMSFFLLGGLTYVNLIFPLKPSDFRKIRSKLCCLCVQIKTR